jgi:hypothetical protein
MTATTPYRSSVRVGRDGFLQVLRAEWTKLRTVRGWVIGTVLASGLIVVFGLITVAGTSTSVAGPPEAGTVPVGPDGFGVIDRFTFVHQPLAGDGTVTARVVSLAGERLPAWAKAGIIVKDGVTPGSTYAAVMVTGGQGVRLQHDYLHDTPGRPGSVSASSPRWLRLHRAGSTLTAWESTDGTTWSEVGRATLDGLPARAEVGLFVASPAHEERHDQGLGGLSVSGQPTSAAAAFDNVTVEGGSGAPWTGTAVGDAGTGGFREAGGTFAVEGTGDIAPVPLSNAGPTFDSLVAGGTAVGIIAMIVVAATFITAEYRQGLILTTLAASPRRGRVLAAKAVVIGTVTFLTSVVALAVTTSWGAWLLEGRGVILHPVPTPVEVRVVVGTAALLAVSAVFTLAVGTVLRHGAGTVTLVITVILIPHLVALATGIVPESASNLLMTATPAVGFAIQQSVPQFALVDSHCTHGQGCYPVAPWVGFGLLCAYTAVALGLAAVMLRRRDA